MIPLLFVEAPPGGRHKQTAGNTFGSQLGQEKQNRKEKKSNMTLKEYYDTCQKILNDVLESEEAKTMRFTVEDLHIIIDALDDTIIIQQAVSLVHKSQYEREEIKRRIDKTTRTKAKLLLILKDEIEKNGGFLK